MSIFVGIDTGLDGAVAVISERMEILSMFDTPTLTVEGKTKTVTGNTKKRREYHLAAMKNYLVAVKDNGTVMVALEKSQAMPSKLQGRTQGTVSSFSTGRGYGLWEGLLCGLGIPYTLVHPLTWKAAMMRDMGKQKGASIIRANQLFSNASLTRKKDHGRADALLVAEFLRRQHGPTSPQPPITPPNP